jgi:hypothetical protein
MSLKDEIAALRDEIDKRAGSRLSDGTNSDRKVGGSEPDIAELGVDRLVALAKDTVEELGNDVDKFPRVAAITTFGAGFALGFALGRQTR